LLVLSQKTSLQSSSKDDKSIRSRGESEVSAFSDESKDNLALGPFLRHVETRLESLTHDQLKDLLLEHARGLASDERNGFLYLLNPKPGNEDEQNAESQGDFSDESLNDDITSFVENLENGVYYEWWGWDDEIHDERAFGDESWAEEMDDLFARAAEAFLSGELSLARDILMM